MEQAFNEVYTKFKMHFYRKVFERVKDREMTLTTIETFCMEIIHALKGPTINEFASFLGISSPNATYKVNSLIQKGYVKKTRSSTDGREFHLNVTERYYDYYLLSYEYISVVTKRISSRFSKKELVMFDKMLRTVSDELMTEVLLPAAQENIKAPLPPARRTRSKPSSAPKSVDTHG